MRYGALILLVSCTAVAQQPGDAVVGLGENGDARFAALSISGSLTWLRLPWAQYHGESRPAGGNLDGDSRPDMVVGLGSGGGGWIAFYEQNPEGWTFQRWWRLPWSQYDAASGATTPALGDLDGDGLDECVLGLASAGGGRLAVIRAPGFAPSLAAWVRVPWWAYSSTNGETRPAAGNFDGDARKEIVVGLGRGGAGRLWRADDQTTAFAHVGWMRVPWSAYNSANGETRPAAGRIDALLNDQVLIGLGSGSGGWLSLSNPVEGTSRWLRVTGPSAWNGETRPSCADTDEDGRAEALIGLGRGGAGRLRFLHFLDGTRSRDVVLGAGDDVWPSLVPQRPGPTVPSGYVIDFVEDLPEPQTVRKHVFPVPSGPVPARGVPFVQPETGTRITRLSDIRDDGRLSGFDGDPANGLTNGYSRFAASNVNDRYVLAYSSNQVTLLYELPTLTFRGPLTFDGVNDIGESNDPRWDMSGVAGTETAVYYQLEDGIYRQDVVRGYTSQELVYAFSEPPLAEDHMDQDRHARYRAVRFPDRVVVLDMRRRVVLPGEVRVPYGGCDMSPEGTWLYVQGFGDGEETRFYRTADLAQGNVSSYVLLPTRSHGHDGWAYDLQGDEVYTFQDNTNDWFSTFNPRTLERIDIMNMVETGWEFGQHMGRTYLPANRGWLLMSSYTTTNDRWADNQIFLLEIAPHTQGPRIWRIASTHNLYQAGQYFEEAFASLSASGTSVLWGANWMGQDNLELYRAELPTDWHTVLAR